LTVAAALQGSEDILEVAAYAPEIRTGMLG
jgi:hypothetical protein